MSDQDTEEQDPSIEEILDSIRQIISDDEDDESGEEQAVEEEPAPEPQDEPEDEPEEDVIDLTDEIEPEEEAEDEPEPEPAPAPEPVQKPAPAPKPAKKEPIDVIMEETDGEEKESILTRGAETAALKGFTEVVRKTAVEHNGITLEEIVRTELRPLLKGWLDDHLPSIIERLVQDELERLSKRALEE